MSKPYVPCSQAGTPPPPPVPEGWTDAEYSAPPPSPPPSHRPLLPAPLLHPQENALSIEDRVKDLEHASAHWSREQHNLAGRIHVLE